jgi:hypothetical protein
MNLVYHCCKTIFVLARHRSRICLMNQHISFTVKIKNPVHVYIYRSWNSRIISSHSWSTRHTISQKQSYGFRFMVKIMPVIIYAISTFWHKHSKINFITIMLYTSLWSKFKLSVICDHDLSVNTVIMSVSRIIVSLWQTNEGTICYVESSFLGHQNDAQQFMLMKHWNLSTISWQSVFTLIFLQLVWCVVFYVSKACQGLCNVLYSPIAYFSLTPYSVISLFILRHISCVVSWNRTIPSSLYLWNRLESIYHFLTICIYLGIKFVIIVTIKTPYACQIGKFATNMSQNEQTYNRIRSLIEIQTRRRLWSRH